MCKWPSSTENGSLESFIRSVAVGWDGMGRLSIDHRSIGNRSKEEADWTEKKRKNGRGHF